MQRYFEEVYYNFLMEKQINEEIVVKKAIDSHIALSGLRFSHQMIYEVMNAFPKMNPRNQFFQKSSGRFFIHYVFNHLKCREIALSRKFSNLKKQFFPISHILNYIPLRPPLLIVKIQNQHLELSDVGWLLTRLSSDLQELYLNNDSLEKDGLSQLFQWGDFRNLRILSLNFNTLTGLFDILVDKVQKLERFFGINTWIFSLKRYSVLRWSRLTHLNLSGGRLCTQNILSLLRSDLPKLTVLKLFDTRIGDHDLKLIWTRGNWPLLEEIDVSGNRFTLYVRSVLRHSIWPKLTCIEISVEPTSFHLLSSLSLYRIQVKVTLMGSLDSDERAELERLKARLQL